MEMSTMILCVKILFRSYCHFDGSNDNSVLVMDNCSVHRREKEKSLSCYALRSNLQTLTVQRVCRLKCFHFKISCIVAIAS